MAAEFKSSEFKAEDVNDPTLLKKLLEDIHNNPEVLDTLPAEELLRITKLVSPYGDVPESTETNQWVCLSFTNLKQEYMKKLHMTGLVGYLYRRCDEYGRLYKDTVENMDDMAVAEKQVIANQRRVVEVQSAIISALRLRDELKISVDEDTPVELANRELYDLRKTEMVEAKILELREFSSNLNNNRDLLRLKNQEIGRLEEELDSLQGYAKRFIIRQFLDEQFRFNPDKHVRASYVGTSSKSTSTSAYIDKFVPPADTFHGYQYYMDSNYEELRGVTEKVYKIKADTEVAILPYANFTSVKDANDFVDRNKDSVIADIRTLKYGKWNLLDSFKANRDTIEAYRGTIVQDMLDQIKEDTKVGAELVKNRATRRQRQNLKELGPAPKAVSEYMKDHTPGNPESSETKEEEAKRIYEEHQAQKKEYECALLAGAEKDEPAPHDALRVNVYTMRAGGQKLDESHILTKAVAPKAMGDS